MGFKFLPPKFRAHCKIPRTQQKKSVTAMKVEETKINFFDAEKYEEQ